ncbi:hypothetical protein [Clostridium akagii]|uniref:hypothetical protein n=1 Tax=Clostridium akagii TaxID=91623 RepID=UPI000AB72337|nr:hypothetical protein [Clostridium akagii]
MSDKSIELMKKLIEEKKNKGLNKGGNNRPDKSIGNKQKGFNNTKQGGVFDK